MRNNLRTKSNRQDVHMRAFDEVVRITDIWYGNTLIKFHKEFHQYSTEFPSMQICHDLDGGKNPSGNILVHVSRAGE